MNLKKWTEYSGEIPILLSAIIIIVVSISFGGIMYQFYPSWAFTFGICVGLSGFMLVILPNIVFLRRLLSDNPKGDEQE